MRRGSVLAVALVALTGCTGSQVKEPQPVDSARYNVLAQEVFKETNRLRANPKAYAAVLRDVAQRIKEGIYYPANTEVGVRMAEGTVAVKEAISVIAKQAPLPTLRWSEALANAAREHVRDTGPKGLVSHESSSGKTMAQRLKPVMAKEGFNAVAENISYGLEQGQDVVAHLFIDDGVPGRGHRKNLLMQKLNYTGVACGSHQRYREMCVAIYAYRPE